MFVGVVFKLLIGNCFFAAPRVRENCFCVVFIVWHLAPSSARVNHFFGLLLDATELGSEGDGLRPEVLAACDVAAAIPMPPTVDLLNVTSAAAVFLYEAARQRGRQG